MVRVSTAQRAGRFLDVAVSSTTVARHPLAAAAATGLSPYGVAASPSGLGFCAISLDDIPYPQVRWPYRQGPEQSSRRSCGTPEDDRELLALLGGQSGCGVNDRLDRGVDLAGRTHRAEEGNGLLLGDHDPAADLDGAELPGADVVAEGRNRGVEALG